MEEIINEIDISLACCLDDISVVTEEDIEHIYQTFEKLLHELNIRKTICGESLKDTAYRLYIEDLINERK